MDPARGGLVIPEAFLIMALSVAPVGFPHNPHHLARDGVSFSKLLKTEQGKVLFVEGQIEVVSIFRKCGIAAFGTATDAIQGITPWHVIGDVGTLPFAPGLFHQLYWLHEKSTWQEEGFHELVDALKLVEPHGYFLFDPDVWIHWPVWLKGRGWQVLPFQFLGFSIWQRRMQEDHHMGPSAWGRLRRSA